MSQEKKQVRDDFRSATFARDKYHCRGCGTKKADYLRFLDAHHITDRNLMPHGGYVKENGISLCPLCHEKAEVFHSTGTAISGFAPEDLYKMIDSSYDSAVKASEKLK